MTAAHPRVFNSLSPANNIAVNPGHSRIPAPSIIMKKIPALLLAALGCALFHADAAVMPAEKLLPDDTLAVFSIPDFGKIRDFYQSSPQGQLWNDPALKPFKDKLMGKVQSDLIAPMERDLGVHLDDFANLPQGQVTIAVIQNGWHASDKDSIPALVLLLDAKDKSPQLKTSITDLRKKWVDAGKTIRSEKIRDVEFSVILLSNNDLAKSSKKKGGEETDSAEKNDTKARANSELFVGQVDSLLIVGSNGKALEKIVSRMSGGSVKSLSEVPSFDSMANSMFRDSLIFGWINTKALIDELLKSLADESKGNSQLPFKPEAVVSALGFNGLKTVAFSSRNTSEGAEFTFMLGVPESSRTGLFKILAGEAKDCTPPPFVPGDAVKFQRYRIDGQKAWAGIRKMAADISPQASGTLDFMLGSVEESAKEKDPSFDIKKNLFGNLGDDIISYDKNPRGTSLAELSSPPSLFLISSPNADQLAGAVKSLLVMTPLAAPTEREFLGRKIYTITPPATPGAPAAASVSYSSSGGYLAVSADAAMLEEYLRSNQGQGKPLREMPGLMAASQKVLGPGSSLFGYSNEGETMRVLFDLLKKDTKSGDPFGSMGPALAAAGLDTSKVKEWVDVTLLPAYERVSKYFYFTVYGAGATPDGLVLKSFSPVPPQLKK
jgi:hypothetical protein